MRGCDPWNCVQPETRGHEATKPRSHEAPEPPERKRVYSVFAEPGSSQRYEYWHHLSLEAALWQAAFARANGHRGVVVVGVWQ